MQNKYSTIIITNGLIVLLLATLFSACSTSKDGFAYRVYHNTTAHFNGHFNSNENLQKGLDKILLAHTDDYDEILPIFIYGTEESVKPAYPELEKTIEKSSKVIDRHTIKADAKKDRKHPVKNKWIDENYMLIGQGHFYKKSFFKAEELFNYVFRKYDEDGVKLSALTWLARSYIERKEYGQANSTLAKGDVTKEIDDDLVADYYMVWADNYIHQEDYKKAAEKLETAIGYIGKKRNRARPHFVLAQLYQRLTESSDALTHYEAVIKSRAPYEMEFYARIMKAMAFNRTSGNSNEIKEELFKLLKDDKNVDYQDQIYYALGDLELEEQNRDQAVTYFEKSLEVNKGNQKQKAKTFLRLADLYFDERQYEDAQMYYDSTFTNITDQHKRYKEIKARAESLTELIGYLNTIEMNDSLLRLCSLDEQALLKELKKVIKQKEEEIAEKKRLAEEALANAGNQTNNAATGNFWVYNDTQRKKGYDNFKDYWGDRPLEDDWRRSNKISDAFNQDDTQDENPESDIAAEDTDVVPTIEELMASLPCNNEAMIDEMASATAEAHYNAGVLYKERLDDNENAINIWEQLVSIMDESEFHPTTYYQLFRTYFNREQEEGYSNPFCNKCNSKYWGDQIKQRYPGSEWARLVDNPQWLDTREMKEALEREAYEMVYYTYVERNYVSTIHLCDTVINNQPDNHLLCKYRLLRAVCVGYTDAPYGIRENYQRELNQVVQNCPGSEEASRASELLTAFNSNGHSQLKEEIKVDESTAESSQVKTEKEDATSIYKYNDAIEHYFALVFPVQGTDINKIKAAIADFNTTNYNSAALKLTNNLFSKEAHIVLVKTFKTIPEGIEYLNTFRGDNDHLGEINAQGYNTFLVSKTNYITLFKDKNLETYLEWYYLNYNQ